EQQLVVPQADALEEVEEVGFLVVRVVEVAPVAVEEGEDDQAEPRVGGLRRGLAELAGQNVEQGGVPPPGRRGGGEGRARQRLGGRQLGEAIGRLGRGSARRAAGRRRAARHHRRGRQDGGERAGEQRCGQRRERDRGDRRRGRRLGAGDQGGEGVV